VIVCEEVLHWGSIAKTTIARNGMANQIQFVSKNSKDLKVINLLPV
jgi:hypothetical protein